MVARLTGEIACRPRSPPPTMRGLVVGSSATFWRSARSWPIASWTEGDKRNRTRRPISAFGRIANHPHPPTHPLHPPPLPRRRLRPPTPPPTPPPQPPPP